MPTFGNVTVTWLVMVLYNKVEQDRVVFFLNYPTELPLRDNKDYQSINLPKFTHNPVMTKKASKHDSVFIHSYEESELCLSLLFF